MRGRTAIIVTEMPYQVNKARMVERIAEVVREKKVEGIADLRDESDRHGVRVVIEVKRDADPDIVLNQLFQFTPLQTSFGINMVALRGGRPEQLGLQGDARGLHRLPRGGDPPPHRLRPRRGARAGAHRGRPRGRGRQHRRGDRADPRRGRPAGGQGRPDGAALAAGRRPAADPAGRGRAKARPRGQVTPDGYRLSEEQAKAILELRLQRLTALERDKLTDELKEIATKIDELLLILRSRERLLEVMKAELLRIKELFDTPRRTFIDLDAEPDIDIEELIQREDMVVTVTHKG